MEEAFNYGTTVAVQAAILFVLIFAGYFIGKFKLINRTGVDQLIDVLLYVVTPVLIVNSFLSVKFSSDTIADLGISALCAFLTHFVGIAAAFIFCKTKPEEKRAVYRNGIIFSNGGFMAIPLVDALAGDYGVFLVSTYIIALNVISWVYGARLFPGGKNTGRIKAVLNPGTIGVLIGLPLFLFVPEMPKVIAEPISYIADLNTPIAMFITGFFLIGSDLLSAIKDLRLWAVSLIRLLAIPLVMLFIFKFGFGLRDELLIACMVPACAPCAVNNMMFAAKFGGDTALASRMISFTTILSMITMPVILALTKL